MKKFISKGQWYYEFQILMVVFMWQHNMEHKPKSNHGFRRGRLFIWRDTAWKNRGLVGDFFWFFTRLFCNVDKFKSPKVKFNVVKINAKSMFRKWITSKPWWVALMSIRAYLYLHKHGFRITQSGNGQSEIPYRMHRFHWKGVVIRDTADIDQVGNRWSSVRNGHVQTLEVSDEYKVDI